MGSNGLHFSHFATYVSKLPPCKRIPSGAKKPLVIDLFCGLHGWGKAFAREGFHVVGFDIEDMCDKFGYRRPKGVELVLQDILTLHGSQFKDAACIVASPPCQEYSYRAMPWKRAKALPPPSNDLFDACFRIQREACEAAGRYIPLIVENVVGAQKWVGRAKWHFGSYYLFGDIPKWMPAMPVVKEFQNDDKRRKCGGDWFGSGKDCSLMRQMSSHSLARKAASAQIAKIPETLARWIARCARLGIGPRKHLV